MNNSLFRLLLIANFNFFRLFLNFRDMTSLSEPPPVPRRVSMPGPCAAEGAVVRAEDGVVDMRPESTYGLVVAAASGCHANVDNRTRPPISGGQSIPSFGPESDSNFLDVRRFGRMCF